MRDVIQAIDKELGEVIQYALNNFREGQTLKFNKKSLKEKKEMQQDVNYKIFDKFLNSRALFDPYQDCAINKFSQR